MPKRRILVKITDTIPIVRIRKNGFSLEPFKLRDMSRQFQQNYPK